jgi:hypothetical protein
MISALEMKVAGDPGQRANSLELESAKPHAEGLMRCGAKMWVLHSH